MKKFLAIFALTTISLSSQEPTSSNNKKTIFSENSHSTITIDVKQRAEDLVKAFHILKIEKPSDKVFCKTTKNKALSNVADISLIGNGTLMLIKTNSTNELKYRIVQTEDIQEIGLTQKRPQK